jgi:hypothetical protein
MIDSDRADEEWASRTRQQMPPFSRRGGQQDDDVDVFSMSQYTKARAVYAHYQARLAKLEFEERQGSLVRADEVKVATFNMFRRYRDTLLNVPDRICASIAAEIKDLLVKAGMPAELAGAIDFSRVHAIQSAEIRKALNDFCDSETNAQ